MTPLEGIRAEASDDYTLVLLAGMVLTLVLGGRALGRRRVGIVAFTLLHTALVPLAGTLRAEGSHHYQNVRLVVLIFAGVAAVSMAGVLLFNLVLPRLRVQLPKILQDVTVGVASIFVLFAMAARAGFNLSSLITTSAVLTAVIGLALQDTLGNIVGGLALQTDDSIRVGDWIAIAGREGRVTEIRWRYTAIETRDWETVFIPNSQLVKEQVRVLGRRAGAPVQWRRWVRFNVDFRFTPLAVTRVVTSALRGSPLNGVAGSPEPDCVVLTLGESFATYAVRYHLTALATDALIDHRVLTRVYFALRRAGIPLSMPAHALFVTQESSERKQAKTAAEHALRIDALHRIGLLSPLSEEELHDLADHLERLMFAPGEHLAVQDDEGDCLYVLARGRVAVRVERGGRQTEVAQLGAGDFFGEMSLLTGERRTATVVAVEEVEAYRLDKTAFEQILERRPEMVEHLAETLAARRGQLDEAHESLHQAKRTSATDSKSDLLGRIRVFFGIGDD